MSIVSPRRKSSAPVKNGKSKAAAPVIDFPREGERITSGHYAVRISAAVPAVEVSVNSGPWHKCRHSVGFHWFDWANSSKGSHRLIARVVSPDGGGAQSAPRSCQVS
jgi:hypothetical protein